MSGRIAGLFAFALAYVSYWMPYIGLILVVAYLAFIIRDVVTFRAASHSDWKATTLVGNVLREKQMLHERNIAQLEYFSRKPLVQAEIIQKRNTSLEDMQRESGAEFVSYHYLLDGEAQGKAVGAALERIEELMHSRFRDFLIGSIEPLVEIVSESELSGLNLSSTGARYTVGLPFILQEGEGAEYRVMLVFGFINEPFESDIKELKVLAENYKSTLFEEVFARHTHQAVRRKDDLMAHLGHDLRSPLNNIKSALNCLLEDSKSKSAKDLCSSALTNCDGLADIISDMLDFARFKEGNLKPVRSDVDVATIVESVFRSFKPQADARKVALDMSVDEGVLLNTDPNHLRRIVSNLVSNAIKYSRAGGSCLIEAHVSDNGNLLLSVSDNGYGMSQKQLENLFQPYSRYHEEVAEGVGLGMAIFQILVGLGGGKIAANSEENIGTTITVTYPSAFVSRSQITSHQSIQAQIKVLVIDDDLDVLSSLERTLNHPAILLHTASSINEAKAVIEKVNPQVLVTDSELPDGSGQEAIRSMLNSNPDACCAVITGSDDFSTRKAYQNLNVDMYLLKPAPLLEVRRWILSLGSKEQVAA